MAKTEIKEPLGLALTKLILSTSLIVSIGALIGAIGYLVSQPVISPSISVASNIITEPSPKINWKTHESVKDGYAISYPAGWTTGESIQSAEDDSGYSTNETKFESPDFQWSEKGKTGFAVYISVVDPHIDWRDYSGPAENFMIKEKIALNSYDANLYILKDPDSVMLGFPAQINFVTPDKKIIINGNFSEKDLPEFLALFKEMAKSFKFTEKDENGNLIPGCNPIISLPFHNGGKILQVYNFKDPKDYDNYNDYILQCVDSSDSIDPDNMSEELRLFVDDIQDKSLIFVGKIQGYYGSNSGGIFVPYAITKDDGKIILRARMGGPGAGGGMIDYGYAIIPIKPATPNTKPLIDQNSEIVRFPYDFPEERSEFTPSIAPRSAHFYDLFGKVVYIDEGNKTPHYAMPGPSNNGAIMFRNLVTNTGAKKILEEKDTSYEITNIDEKNKILKFKAIKYSFSADCPKEEDAFSLSCADKTIVERTISLP